MTATTSNPQIGPSFDFQSRGTWQRSGFRLFASETQGQDWNHHLQISLPWYFTQAHHTALPRGSVMFKSIVGSLFTSHGNIEPSQLDEAVYAFLSWPSTIQLCIF